MDHTDNEKKIEYSSCFDGVFSEEAFNRYWEMLDATLHVYAKQYESIAAGKKLDSELRKQVRKMIDDLSHNLPARIKPENEETFNRIAEALGRNLSAKSKKLLNYLVEHAR